MVKDNFPIKVLFPSFEYMVFLPESTRKINQMIGIYENNAAIKETRNTIDVLNMDNAKDRLILYTRMPDDYTKSNNGGDYYYGVTFEPLTFYLDLYYKYKPNEIKNEREASIREFLEQINYIMMTIPISFNRNEIEEYIDNIYICFNSRINSDFPDDEFIGFVTANTINNIILPQLKNIF